MLALKKISARNFLSLKKVDVELSHFNVLVGPNGTGKTNLLLAIRFLGEIARTDLVPAIESFDGIGRLLFRGKRDNDVIRDNIGIRISGQFTKHSSANALDEYSINIMPLFDHVSEPRIRLIARGETFQFKRTKGRGRRITISGGKVEVISESPAVSGAKPNKELTLEVDDQSSGLSTLRRLGEKYSASQIDELAALLETFRVFEVDVTAARQPSTVTKSDRLLANAKNLSAFLNYLHAEHAEVFASIVEDLHYLAPSIRQIELVPASGAIEGVVVELVESGLNGRTPLAHASFGTIRALALLAMLHDPNPPKLTCVEEIDHGLHPYALDRIVERLREASSKTQIIVATHSPAFVNRLEPHELIVCERDNDTGESRIPAIDPATVQRMVEASELRLGELWFSGSLGGVIG